MMRVVETFNSFTGEVDVGRFAYFLKLGKDGVEVGVDGLVEDIMNFPRLVVFGDEPFFQAEELKQLLTKLANKKKELQVVVKTNGTIRPVGIGSLGNVKYDVYLQLKNSGVDYDRRVKSDSVNWFATIGANFVFVVNGVDDVDEASMIVQEFGISKAQVYLTVKGEANTNQLKMLTTQCRSNGYSFTLDYGSMFWPHDGRY